jgi:hypothetical protein
MRIVLQDSEGAGIVGREYLFDGPEGAQGQLVFLTDGTVVWGAEGEFVLLASGTVVYRHDGVAEMFTNSSRDRFVACVDEWNKYVADVRLAHGEAEQLRVVDQLRRNLQAQGDLRPGSFWENVLSQAEWGHL